ncbi:MAG: hypothetical protein ACR2PW_04100, partial [Gammaproteobacteria bacterium]
IECEVAFWCDAKGQIQAVAPAFELVFVQFSQPTDMTAANLVASNMGADLYIVGDRLPWSANLQEIAMVLRRDGVVVNDTSAAEALDGPLRAAQWMWKEAQNRQFVCGEQTLFLAGACGQVVPASCGCYEADFGPLGRLSLEVA